MGNVEDSANTLTSPPTSNSDALKTAVRTLKETGLSVVPLADACAACDDPCDLGSFPRKFDVDLESEMLGSTKGYRRQVIFSTGVSNWEHEVTDVQGTLAAYLSEVSRADASTQGSKPAAPLNSEPSTCAPTPGPSLSTGTSAPNTSEARGAKSKGDKKKDDAPNPALFATSSSSRIAILNGSFRSASDDPDTHQTALVLPDFKYVIGIAERREDAEELWRRTVSPGVGRGGLGPEKGEGRGLFETRVLPYDSVVLLCSHKKRDNRCGIAAPILEKGFTAVLEARGWEVHHEIEVDHDTPPLEDYPSDDPAARDAELVRHLREREGHTPKRALIVKVSHIGGHKYAGNVIVYSPTGTAVWYGRVSPKEVTAVVDGTIVSGRVIPELLRAGVNISNSRRRSLYDW